MFQISMIGKEQIEQIHLATLRILSETGIILTHDKVRSLLGDHGAKIKKERVLLPGDLVERCLVQLPSKVILQGRDIDKTIELGSGSCYSHNVGGVPNVYEPRNNSRRPAIREDVERSTLLLDALANVDSITPLYTPQDVPGEQLTLWMMYDTLLNTTKPIRAPGVQTGREVNALADMFQIACPAGTATMGVSPISPLNFPDDIVDAILMAVKQGFVLGPLPCPILGATAPMSIAGGLAQQNAEVLATVVLGQLTKPGCPMIYKGRLSVMDARSGLSVWGNPEIGMISAATVQIGHYYGMPVDVYGFCTNSHTIDVQSGFERSLNAVLPILADADEISGIGEMEGGVMSSLAQILIDHELITYLKRIQRSFDVNSDSLAVDEIANVMSGSNNFLAETHTVKYLRSGEIMRPEFAFRDTWSQWAARGKPNLVDWVGEQSSEIIKNHPVVPLSEEQRSTMMDIIQAY